MTNNEAIKCHIIIHSASASAAAIGAGLAQIPCADSIPLVAIQATMIVSLGKVFGVKLKKSSAKAIVCSFAAGFAGRNISQITVGWIPAAGNVINATTAAGLTETMGWFIADSFSKSIFDEKKIIDNIYYEANLHNSCDDSKNIDTVTQTVIVEEENVSSVEGNTKQNDADISKFAFEVPEYSDEELNENFEIIDE